MSSVLTVASSVEGTKEDSSITATKPSSLTDFDEIEKSLGISAYMSPSAEGFSAVVKARYSDFVVHEVGLDGTIARLTSRDIPKSLQEHEEPLSAPAPTSNEGVEVPEKVVEGSDGPPSDQWPTLQSQLEEMIKDAAVAEKVMTVMQAHNQKKSCDDKFVTLPPLEKPQRKAIHDWVRGSLSCARADTLEGRIRIWHVKFEKEMPNFQSFGSHKRGHDSRNSKQQPNKRSKKSWPEDRPDFLQFVLYKENIDTTTATKELSRKGSKARIGYAGMKDKRGITTQYCTMFRTEPQQIIADRQKGGGGNTKQNGNAIVQVGNFEYVSKEMRLGTLRGNRFDLVLRNVQAGCDHETKMKEILENAANSTKELGFINYFGTQRFGKYQDTHLVGIAVLQGDFEKAIDIFMAPKPDDRPDAAKGRKEWQDRFLKGKTAENEAATAKRVIKTLNRFMTAENAAMQSLSRYPQDYKRAFTCIPKTLRMMFLHAVQSLVWNQAASHRITMSKVDVSPGDLVMLEESSNASDVHVVTDDDISNNRFTIVDVVLPLIGTKSKFPTNEMGELMKRLLQDQGVTVDNFKKIQDKDLALNGDYRKLLCRPSDFDYEIKEYFDPKQPLLQTDLMKLAGEEIVITPSEEGQSKKIAMIVGFSLPASSYATVALRELMKKPTSSEYQKDLKLE